VLTSSHEKAFCVGAAAPDGASGIRLDPRPARARHRGGGRLRARRRLRARPVV
jgi:hypothetical protein